MLLLIEAGKYRLNSANNWQPLNWTETKVSEKAAQNHYMKENTALENSVFFNRGRFKLSRRTIKDRISCPPALAFQDKSILKL